jgi:folate-binding protein YgfZ
VQLADNAGARTYVLLVGGAAGPQDSISWNLVGRPDARVLELKAGEAEALGANLAEQQPQLVHAKTFAAARIESGMPLFGVDFHEDNLPQEVGRDAESISFTKGCYLGQETVARIDALGHVNQRLVGVRFSGNEVPQAGTELSFGGAKVGRVTSAAWSPRLSAPLALAMVRREANAVGTKLESPFGAAEIVALPLK